jgi:hypothetical protein
MASMVIKIVAMKMIIVSWLKAQRFYPLGCQSEKTKSYILVYLL